MYIIIQYNMNTIEEKKESIFKSPELTKQYMKEYYKNNKTKIIEGMSKKRTCLFCNREVSNCHYLKHTKSNICKTYTALKVKLN